MALSKSSEALLQSLRLSALGRFDEALQALHEASELKDVTQEERIQLYRAAARTYLSRGYPQNAKASIAAAIELASGHPYCGSLAMRVYQVFIEVVGCGGHVEDESCLEDAEDTLQSYNTLQDFDQDTIEMLSVLCRMKLFKRVICQRKGENTLSSIATRLRSLLLEAESQGKWDVLNTLLNSYWEAESRPTALNWLCRVVKREDLPSHMCADIYMKIAEAKATTSTATSLREVLDRAENAFRTCNHAFGAQILEYFRLSHNLRASVNAILDHLAIIDHYWKSDYPIGVIQAAFAPMRLAFNSGNFRAYILIQEVLHNVCISAGISHESLILELQLLAALNAGTGHYAKVKELGQSVYTEALRRQYWSQAYYAGQVVSLACLQARDHEEAQRYAKDIYDICVRENLSLTSQATFHLLLVQTSRTNLTPDEHVKAFQEAAEKLIAAAGEDLHEEEYSLACQKLSYASQLQFDLVRTDSVNALRWRSDAEMSIKTIRSSAQHLDNDAKLEALTNCDDMLVTQLLANGKSKPADEDEAQAIGYVMSLLRLFNGIHKDFV